MTTLKTANGIVPVETMIEGQELYAVDIKSGGLADYQRSEVIGACMITWAQSPEQAGYNVCAKLLEESADAPTFGHEFELAPRLHGAEIRDGSNYLNDPDQKALMLVRFTRPLLFEQLTIDAVA